jgi:hypothetical protein
MEKVIVKDLQTGEFSSFTDVDGIFDYCVEDYLINFSFGLDHMPEEELQARIDKMNIQFDQFTRDERISFVLDEYDYRVIEDPDPETIAEWEDYHDKKFI